jgi:hypothetical protein
MLVKMRAPKSSQPSEDDELSGLNHYQCAQTANPQQVLRESLEATLSAISDSFCPALKVTTSDGYVGRQ